MRILIISNVPPYQLGGAELQAHLLTECFTTLGHNVTLAGHRIPSDQVAVGRHVVKAIRIRVVNWSAPIRAITYAASLSWLVLRQHKHFDVIYCRFLGEATLTLSVLKYVLSLRFPLISCGECAGYIGDAAFLSKMPFHRLLIKALNNSCNAVNVISPDIEGELVGIGLNPSRFTYIPNGIKLPMQALSDCSDKSRRSFVFVGRLVPQKGLQYLFEAFKALLQDWQGVTLAVLGDGPEKAYLQHLALEWKIDRQIRFYGLVRNEEVPLLLAKHDIFVLPSMCEGFSVATVEAMGVGLPVIVTRCGGPEHFVDDSVGRVCNPADAQALRAAMLELLTMDNSTLYELGAAGRRKVIQNYNISKIAQEYIQVFDRCVLR